jgi:predicted transposase YdaD
MRKAVQETIRICKEKKVLAAYLEGEEAATVMFTFADQEREFSRALRKEREAGVAEGEARGRTEGIITTLVNLVSEKLLSVKDAARQANMTEEEFVRKAGLKI